MILKLDHVQLAMPAGREDEARGFYAGVLGLIEVPKPPDLARKGGAWFKSEGIEVHLGVEEGFRPAKKAHPAFVVADLEVLKAALRRAGHEVTMGSPIAGRTRCFTVDPFGNRLEFLQLEAQG